jgi:hypothetical protein
MLQRIKCWLGLHTSYQFKSLAMYGCLHTWAECNLCHRKWNKKSKNYGMFTIVEDDKALAALEVEE